MAITHVFVQLSTRSWQGVPDFSVSPLDDGRPFFVLALEAVRPLQAPVTLLTPSWDDGAALLATAFRDVFGSPLRQVAGWDASPLDRIIAACEPLSDNDYVLRLNGLNAFVNIEELTRLAQATVDAHADAGLYDDDIPPQLTGDILRVGALRRAGAELAQESPFRIHARQAVAALQNAKIVRGNSSPPSDEFLQMARARNEALYRLAHLEYDEKNVIRAGDQLGFHYDIALEALAGRSARVLDIACGVGFGSARLSRAGHEVVGADIDEVVLAEATEKFGALPGLHFQRVDGESMPFSDGQFDVVASFETLEHVNSPDLYLKELRRVLSPGGTLYLSVPQNRWGHIPLNPQHAREYRSADLEALLLRTFANVEVRGIKQGRIMIPGDPIGSNCYAICS